MNKLHLSAVAITLSIALAPAALWASTSLTAEQQTAVTDMLVAQGYQVRKLDQEDGMIEAYVVKDGKRYELYLDSEMKIVRTKSED